MDRRDFLKYFGAGAAVVPLIGGMPDSNTVARLIEPAKVEPVEKKVISATEADLKTMERYGRLRTDVEIIQHRPTPAHFNHTGHGFIIWADMQRVEVTLMTQDRGCAARWNTDHIPYAERPVDCDFEIRVKYRREANQSGQAMGLRHGSSNRRDRLV